MRDVWATRKHAGLSLSKRQPGALYLDSMAEPTCDTHGVELELLFESDLPDGFGLKDGAELWVCPRCFPSSDGIDTGALAESIVSSWDEYSDHFENANPPDIEPDNGGFVFG